MSVSKYKPHLYVVPEDKADKDFAVGFELDPRLVVGSFQVMPLAGGWLKVLDLIRDEYIPKLQKNQFSHVLGIIDCDGDHERIENELAKFPDEVAGRIFLLGAIQTPEVFRQKIGDKSERIGERMAEECFNASYDLWAHEDLEHVSNEIQRAKDVLRPIVFAAN
jgi:hypothetical protein